MSLHNPTSHNEHCSFNVVCQFNNDYIDNNGCNINNTNNNITTNINIDNHKSICDYQPSDNNYNRHNNKLIGKMICCNNLYDNINNSFVVCSPSGDSSSSTNSSYDILSATNGLPNFSHDINCNNWHQNDFNNYNYDEITTTFIASFKRHGYNNETLRDNFLQLSTVDENNSPKEDVNAFSNKSSMSYLQGNFVEPSACINNFFNSTSNATSISQFNYNNNNTNNSYYINNDQQQDFYTYPQPLQQQYQQNYQPLKQILQPQKQKVQKHQQQFKQQSTVQKPEVKLRRTANARERDRTYNVNNAFHHLRSIIPTEPADRKLSKIETIRLATSYIAHLHTVINTDLHLHEQPCVRIRGSLTRLLKMRKLVNLDLEKDCHVIKQLMSGACEGVDDGGDNGPTIICTFCLSASKAHSNGGALF